MSKADNKELEEAVEILEDKECFWNNNEIKVLEAIEKVLKELERLQEDCIEKDQIRELIKSKPFDICRVRLIKTEDLEELLERK